MTPKIEAAFAALTPLLGEYSPEDFALLACSLMDQAGVTPAEQRAVDAIAKRLRAAGVSSLTEKPSVFFALKLCLIGDLLVLAAALEYLDELWHVCGDEVFETFEVPTWAILVAELMESISHDDSNLNLIGEDFALYVESR
jgi:hypothetical protein